MKAAWDKWLEKAKAENVDARKERELKEKIKQIKKLIDEIDKEFGGMKPVWQSRGDTLYFDGIGLWRFQSLADKDSIKDSIYVGRKAKMVIDTTVIGHFDYREFELR